MILFICTEELITQIYLLKVDGVRLSIIHLIKQQMSMRFLILCPLTGLHADDNTIFFSHGWWFQAGDLEGGDTEGGGIEEEVGIVCACGGLSETNTSWWLYNITA